MMEDEAEAPQRITGLALTVELGLAVLAVVIGWLIGKSPSELMNPNGVALEQRPPAWFVGILATVPMVVLLLAIRHFHFGPLLRLNQVVDELLVPLFRNTSITEMALISAAAGIGEEFLFRGLIQGLIAERAGAPYGVLLALIIASVIFGACHWITTSYAVLATVIGLYLGWLFIVTDHLVAPMITHGLYDFVALLYLVKWQRR